VYLVIHADKHVREGRLTLLFELDAALPVSTRLGQYKPNNSSGSSNAGITVASAVSAPVVASPCGTHPLAAFDSGVDRKDAQENASRRELVQIGGWKR